MFQLLISVFLSPEDSGLGHEQPGGRTPGRNLRVSRCQGTLQPRHRLVQDFPAGQRVWEAAALGAPERAVTSGTPTRQSRALTSRARPTLGDGGRHTHSSVSAPTPRLTPRQLPRLPLASKSGHVTPRGGSSAARGHTHRRQRLRGSRSTRSRPWAGQGQPRLRVGINTCWEGQRGFTEPRKVFGTTSGRSEVTGGAQAGTRREAG